MNINTKNIVSITEANQNFSKVARLVDENGAAVILKNNVPRYLVLEFSQAEQEQSTDKESLRAISQRLIAKNRKAFRDIAIYNRIFSYSKNYSNHNSLTLVHRFDIIYLLQNRYEQIPPKESDCMNFYSVRDLRTTQKAIWEKLEQDGEVVITNNGKPSALLFDIGDGDLEETLKAVRQAKAMMAFNSMRGKAAAKGYLSEEEIEAEIAAARQEE